MRVVVVGSGGREHALVRALKHSPSVTEVHALPGSAGMSQEALCHNIDPMDQDAVLAYVKRAAVDLVVIGPEVYLARGLADQLRAQGVFVFGPNQEAARLEASKVFAKEFMMEAQVPTARYHVVVSVEETLKAAESFAPPYVLKADGLAAGKGVFICKDLVELKLEAENLFVKKTLGAAGEKALLEEFQPGAELSFLVLTNGHDFRALPLAQDHKRLKNKDQGPNTGGMGVVAPLQISEELRTVIEEQLVRPSIQQIERKGLMYRGLLYVGVIFSESGPKVLEYNVRFGDPEAQALLPLLNGDWGQTLLEIAKGNLPTVKWNSLFSACVVLAAKGYPDKPEKGSEISGDLFFQTASSYFLHAGTSRGTDQKWTVSGGRVLNAIGLGSSSDEAVRNAYAQAEKASWDGLQKRTDIGAYQR